MYKYFWSKNPITILGVRYEAFKAYPIRKEMVNEVQNLADAKQVVLTGNGFVAHEQPASTREAEQARIDARYAKSPRVTRANKVSSAAKEQAEPEGGDEL